jgi:hypothetical protein
VRRYAEARYPRNKTNLHAAFSLTNEPSANNPECLMAPPRPFLPWTIDIVGNP